MNYTPPPYTFWVLLFIGFFIAAFLTYFDLQRQKVNNKSGFKKPKLSMHYQIFTVYPDDSFDCRLIINNKGTDSARYITTLISFINLDIVTVLCGNVQDITKMSGIPTIQWNYHHSVLIIKAPTKIAELKLKIKDVKQVSVITSKMRAENMDQIISKCDIDASLLKIIKAKIDNCEEVFIDAIDSKIDIVKLALKMATQQDSDKEGSQT